MYDRTCMLYQYIAVHGSATLYEVLCTSYDLSLVMILIRLILQFNTIEVIQSHIIISYARARDPATKATSAHV